MIEELLIQADSSSVDISQRGTNKLNAEWACEWKIEKVVDKIDVCTQSVSEKDPNTSF